MCTHVSTRSIRHLREELASAVRRAAEGERIVVTVAGRPTAQLGPIDDQAPALDRLIASGSLVPPRRVTRWRPPAAVPIWSGVRIDRALVELRG